MTTVDVRRELAQITKQLELVAASVPSGVPASTVDPDEVLSSARALAERHGFELEAANRSRACHYPGDGSLE